MNKAELAEVIAGKTGVNRKEVDKVTEALFESIEEALTEGKKVQITGFGYFEVRKRKERTGRNPRKPDETVHIPASEAPVFKPGSKLKEAVKNRKQLEK